MYYSLGDDHNPNYNRTGKVIVKTSSGRSCVRVVCHNDRICQCVPSFSALMKDRMLLEADSQRNYIPEIVEPVIDTIPTPPPQIFRSEYDAAEEKAWEFLGEFIGKDNSDTLKAGGYYDISAKNGKTYRLTGDGQTYSITDRMWYCLHTDDENFTYGHRTGAPDTDGRWDTLPRGDKLAAITQWLQFYPEKVEEITQNHRRSCREHETACWD